MGHKARLKQIEKINWTEEAQYFEELVEVLPKIGTSKRQVDEVE